MPETVDGSPRNAQCSTTASQGTATTISLLESIRAAEGSVSHISGPMPLFLIPHVVAAEVRKYRDKVVEVRILRTFGHTYLMNVMTLAEPGIPPKQMAEELPIGTKEEGS